MKNPKRATFNVMLFIVSLFFCSVLLPTNLLATTEAVPTGLEATYQNNKVNLNWNALVGADSYKIYKNQLDGTFSWIGDSSSTSNMDTDVLPGNTYSYKVSAVINSTEGQQCAPVSIIIYSGGQVYTANALVKIDINSGFNNGAGIFIGIQGIKNQSGQAVQGFNLGGYQIEIDYNPEKVTILHAIDEANMDNFTRSIVQGKVYIAGASESGTVNYDELVFVPLVVNGSTKDLTELSVRFVKVVDVDLNEISFPEQYNLNFQRGKIVNQETGGDPSISDALAGLQYLANNRDPGLDAGQVNLINMGSINQSENQTSIVEPNVKDIIALMQYLVRSRNDYFEPVIPQATDLAITSVSALITDGHVLSVEFNKAISSVSKSEVKIVNLKTQAHIGVESVELSEDGKTLVVLLYDDSTSNVYEIEYLTDYMITVKGLSFTFQRDAFKNGRIRDVDVDDRTIAVDGSNSINIPPSTLLLNIPTSTSFDFQASLGAKVRVWFNKDLNLTKIVYETENVVTGKLEVIETRVAAIGNGTVAIDGVEYKLANNLGFFNNDSARAIGVEGTEYDYAKVFFDTSGEKIEFIESYDYDGFFIVKSTDGDVAISYDNNELDLEDYIIFKDGKSISISDLVKDDILYFEDSSNGGDGIAEVYNKSVSGTIATVYLDKVKIGTTNYSFLAGKYGDAQYLDGDEFNNFDTDKAEEFQAGGAVKLYLDRFDNVVYIEGTAIAINSNTVSAYNLENIIAYFDSGIADRGTLEMELLNEEGDNVIKTFRVSTLDKVTVGSVAGVSIDYEVDDNFPGTPTEIQGFRLVQNGSYDFDLIAVDSNSAQIGVVINRLTPSNTADTLIRYTVDDSGSVKGLEFLTSLTQMARLKLDDNYVNTGFRIYRLQSDTVVYDASKGFHDANHDGVMDAGEFDPDAEDISISTWSELAGNDYDILEADVYADEDSNVDYLVIKQTGIRQTGSEETNYNAVITSVLRNSDYEVVEIKALVDGTEKTYQVDAISSSILKGQSVVLTVNAASVLVVDITDRPAELVTGVVIAIDLANKEITVNGITFRLITSGYVYDATDVSDITVEQFRDIGFGDTVEILLDEAGTFYAEVITIRD